LWTELNLSSQDSEILASKLTSSERTVTWLRATHPIWTGKCPDIQHLKLFTENCVLVDSKSTSSVKKMSWWTASHPLQSGHCSGGQLILVSQKSVMVERTHPLQSGQ
jgi:hypothetical protein